MPRYLLIAFLIAFAFSVYAQPNAHIANRLCINYKIPEIGYAVVSSDSVLEISVMGVQRWNTNYKANINDKFRIGSNTKTITSYIAALIIKQGKINWETNFFDLFPELKLTSHPAYLKITLKELITLRAPVPGWTYTYQSPKEAEIKGNDQEQRYNFIRWILKQPPLVDSTIFFWSNPSYVMAGLMLEKATGKTYETLVNEFGSELGIQFELGAPNLTDENQPWGHNQDLEPEKPAVNVKLNWLAPAGNISTTLPDYSKFIQLQLKGLLGQSKTFTAAEFEMMHYGLPQFAYGWRWYVDEQTNLKYSFHLGNPGTFLTKVYICKETNRAFILFANVQSEDADTGLRILLDELKSYYGS